MNVDAVKREYVPKYLIAGKEKFYKFLLLNALNKLVFIERGIYKGITPDIEYLDYYDQLIVLYRREGDTEYLNMASIFRKLAHKIYRVMLKKNMTKYNSKFLNLV